MRRSVDPFPSGLQPKASRLAWLVAPFSPFAFSGPLGYNGGCTLGRSGLGEDDASFLFFGPADFA